MLDVYGQDAAPDAGLPVCDREAFAQVWSRVSRTEDSPVEVVPPAEAVPEPAGAGRELQELVEACLAGAWVYRDLARRSRRNGAGLTALARRKIAQAKRLSAAYFLRSGVRYWPQETVRAARSQDFFPTLRERFLAEDHLARTLGALADTVGDPWYRELYQALAAQTEEDAMALRRMVEREM